MDNEDKDSHNSTSNSRLQTVSDRFVEERKSVTEDRKERAPRIRGNLVRIIFSSNESNQLNNSQQQENNIPVTRNRRRYSNMYEENSVINTTEEQKNTRDDGNIYNMIMSGNITSDAGDDEDEEVDDETERKEQPNSITTETSRRDPRSRVENMRQDSYNRLRARLSEAPPLDIMFGSTDYEDDHQPRHRQDGIPCPETGTGEEAKAVVLQCSICRNNQIQTVNFPCMHACFCLECAKPSVMQSNICPQCRTQYMHISMLYLCYRDADVDDIRHTDKRRKLS